MSTSNILFSKNSFVFALIALNIRLFGASNYKELRVFQGRDAKQGEFPFVVALSLKSWYPESNSERFSPFCTGSIITPVWVLTAGHCFVELENFIDPPNTSPNAKTQKVVIQYVSPKDNSWSASNVIRTLLHPNFKSTDTVVNDIALVKVQNTTVTVFGKISPVHFVSMYGHKVFFLGLGRMKSESGQIGPAITLKKPLQVFDAMVIKCAKNTKIIKSTSFCLAWNCHKPATSCPGDSGGPILHPSGIIGVGTAGANKYCNTTENLNIANVATPVSSYVDWIASNIKEM